MLVNLRQFSLVGQSLVNRHRPPKMLGRLFKPPGTYRRIGDFKVPGCLVVLITKGMGDFQGLGEGFARRLGIAQFPVSDTDSKMQPCAKQRILPQVL